MISCQFIYMRNIISLYLLDLCNIISYHINMKPNYFSEQISNKFKSIDELPTWLAHYPPFKDQIKLLRETLGMTQEQLANKVNRSRRSIQQIERGESAPRISTLHKIAEALNTELKIALVPRQNLVDFINDKASEKAKQLIKLNETSSLLELQPPSEEEREIQVEKLSREIREKRRNYLWNQKKAKK